jgi:hypothetical protein
MELHGDDYEDQGDMIKEFLSNYPNLKWLIIDTCGVGDPVVDKMRKILPRNVNILPLRWNALNHSNIFKHLDRIMKKATFCFPYNAVAKKRREVFKFIDQFINVEKKYAGELMKVHHPDTNDAHDDYVSSVALLSWVMIGRFNSGNLVNNIRVEYDNKVAQSRATKPEEYVESITEKLKRYQKIDTNKINLNNR